jgi:hypothetical protein
MTRFILAAALALAPVSALAQDSSDQGSNLIEEGAQLFLRGLLDEVQPPLQELAGIGAKHLLTLQALAEEMGPAFLEVFDQIDSITYYQAPEILPNGDIVFRRNPGAPAWEPPEPSQRSAPEPSTPLEPFVRPEEAPEAPEPGSPFRPNRGLELEL